MSEEQKQEKVFTNVALGLYNNRGKYTVAKIQYNPETKEVGEIEVLCEEESRIGAENRFKIAIVQQKIFQ